MKKSEIKKIIDANSGSSTNTIKEIIADLEEIKEERELTKSMYFWNPARDASGRRWHEEIRNISLDVEIEGLTVHYHRDYRETCSHVYATDHLWCDEVDTFTVSDIKKIISDLEKLIKEKDDLAANTILP